MENTVNNIIEGLNDSLERGTKHYYKKHYTVDSIESLHLPNCMFIFENDKRNFVNETIEKWAVENDINLFVITPEGFELKEMKYGVMKNRFSSERGYFFFMTKEQIDKINSPRTVLFLKDLDLMADYTYRRTVFNFINRPFVFDESENNEHVFINNLLFAVASAGRTGVDFFEMCTMDAKDCFSRISLDR